MKKELLFLIFLALLARIYLYSLTNWFPPGADVGRFAIISHAWFLKGQITPNLQPYDLAFDFFYFPLPLLLLYYSDYIISPILAVTIISIVISFLGTLVFYRIARIFLDENEAIGAYFWWAFLFDFIFAYAFFGLFPTALTMFFLLILMWQGLEFFFGKEFNELILVVTIAGALLSHVYTLLFMGIFSLALMGWEYVEKGSLEKSVSLGKSCLKGILLTLLLYLPWLLIFGKYLPSSDTTMNISDLFAFTFERETYDLLIKLKIIFGASYVGGMESIWFYFAFLVGIYGTFTGFFKDRNAFLFYLSILITIASFSIFNDMNLLRICSLILIPYAILYGYYFHDFKINLLLLIALFYVQSSGILYMTNLMQFQPDRMVPSINYTEFAISMDWIKHNTPINSTFLTDGGGSGCTGASASYGERIFPETSRRIFYFTDYCWADYNTTEYDKRVNIYRLISINPDDEYGLSQLHLYGVNYVFIGDKPVGFNRILFEKSDNYELVYNQSSFEIFKVR